MRAGEISEWGLYCNAGDYDQAKYPIGFFLVAD
jgi:hypothetical protein